MARTTVTDVFFARAIDGLPRDAILRGEAELIAGLDALGMRLINPFVCDDPRRRCISGMSSIVEEDLRRLASSDVVLADLSLQGRSYIGAIYELATAAQLKKDTHVWVGDSGNEARLFLQCHATSICPDLENTLEVVAANYSASHRAHYRQETSEYYSDCANTYHDRVTQLASKELAALKRERDLVVQWLRERSAADTLIELGSGTGQWVPIWSAQASSVVCVDVSSEMLEVSRVRNAASRAVQHVQCDITNKQSLRRALNNIEIGGVAFCFVLDSMTAEEEAAVLKVLHDMASPGTKLIVVENQKSIFSDRPFFSRVEIQKRASVSGDRVFSLYKRHFLGSDMRRLLATWGPLENIMCTNNYFVAGVARRK